MDIKELSGKYACSAHSAALRKMLEDGGGETVFLRGLVSSAMPAVMASVAGNSAFTFVVILEDAEEASYFYNDIARMMERDDVLFFPSSYRRQVKYGQTDAANEVMRAGVLGHLPSEGVVVVTYPEAICEKVAGRNCVEKRMVRLSSGEVRDPSLLEERLRAIGFVEKDYVYEPGEYAVRGSILDIFSYSMENPVRIDFFGDRVESIRTFDVETQLSEGRLDGIDVIGLANAAEDERVAVTTYFGKGTIVVAKDFSYVCEVAERVKKEGFSELAEKAGASHPHPAGDFMGGEELARELGAFRHVEFGSNALGRQCAVVRYDMSPQPMFHTNFEMLVSKLEEYKSGGYTIYILSDNEKQQERLREIIGGISEEDIMLENVCGTLHEGWTDNALKCCFWTEHQIFDRYHKYTLRGEKVRRGKAALTLKELRGMEIGDYIVHIDMGVGKFGGLVRVPLNRPSRPDKGGAGRKAEEYQEVVRIIYANNDKVDVSIHSLYKISKYKNRDSEAPPALSTLGTGAWDRLKERAKKRVKDIARDLIKLYAQRRKAKGFAFSGDTYMQHELEASFIYEDTPDQLKATNDVKKDMEEAVPMDRLVCGDVGFGKTEVAIRAAFKAACDGKQTAVLVPTTVLALQHYHTFSERLKDMPVRVEYLTRARGARKSRDILSDLEKGSIDIIIGTHKLTGKNVKFKDLGLLIIDEEQKFGVAVKERLRKMKANVDTLAMSATPIPRTLQFSLMGARDMSIINTPPPNRYPIYTELHVFSADIISEAINFEMARGGQVFFVNNRINSLPAMAALIRRRVPDARVAIGHGQMSPEELESVIMGFINYEYDVLLSTTIVENGIDIPNANTIIINDAQRFGLADLHQMRGRVGRSNRKAFCYLLAPPRADLTAEARRRLDALETFSELGSGFNLSMQDLDIRGAGNLLGAEQSGFMEDMGYETYQKILTQAVKELKRDEFSDVFAPREGDSGTSPVRGSGSSAAEWVDDCVVESDLPMYFPEQYVPTSSERMLLYRELDGIEGGESLRKYTDMLKDRFGEIPREGAELLQVVPLRSLGKQLGFCKIVLRQGELRLYMVEDTESGFYKSDAFGRIIDYVCRNPRRCNMKEAGGKRWVCISGVPGAEAAVAVLRDMSAVQ